MLFGLFGSRDHDPCFGHIQRQRFFDNGMLAGLKGGDAGVLVNIVWPVVVKKLNARIVDEFFPISSTIPVAKTLGSFLNGLFVSAADSLLHRYSRRGIIDVGQFFEGVCVGFAHKSIPQHSNADRIF